MLFSLRGGLSYPHAVDVKEARGIKNIARKRFVQGIIAVCRNQNSRRYLQDDRRVIETAVWISELNNVSGLDLYLWNYMGIWPGRLIVHKEAVKIFNAGPRRRTVRSGSVVPAHDRRVIHHSCSRIEALGYKISTVSAKVFKIIVIRIAPKRPFPCIGHSCVPVIRFFRHISHPLHFMGGGGFLLPAARPLLTVYRPASRVH